MTLTDSDFKALGDLIRVTIQDEELVTKSDISHLPTKDEFYEQTAKILKKQDDLETDSDLLSNRVSQHR